MMEEKIVANSEQIYYIARELETVHASLRKLQYILADNSEMCHRLGFAGVEPAQRVFERVIEETIEDYHKLWSKLVLCSEQYMEMIKDGIPLPPHPIFPNFKI